MISSHQPVYTAKLALAFSALGKSAPVNDFVHRASHGKVNRHVLAQRVLHQAVELGAAYTVKKQLLGERSATLVPLLRGAVIDNDLARMREAVANLAGHA